jgi:hypothetical protein
MSEAVLDTRRSALARASALPIVAGGLVWPTRRVNPAALHALGWMLMMGLAPATVYLGTRAHRPADAVPAVATSHRPPNGAGARAVPTAPRHSAAPIPAVPEPPAGFAERRALFAAREQASPARSKTMSVPFPLTASHTSSTGLPKPSGATAASTLAAPLRGPAALTGGPALGTLVARLSNSPPINSAAAGASEDAPVEIQVRQTGASKNQGLLKGVTGPGAMLTTRLAGGPAVGLEAGTMKVGSSLRNYDFGSTSTSMLGLTARVEFAANELNGAATLFNLRQKLAGGLGISVIRMENANFESAQTGRGNSLSRHFTELGVDGKLGSATIGFGVRNTALVKGTTVETLSGWQWVPLGGGLSLSHSAVVPPTGNSLKGIEGSLELDGNAGPLYYSAEFDYGDGTRLRPTGSSISLSGSPAQSWQLSSSLYYDGWDHSVGAGIGLTKRVGGFMIGPTIDMDTRGRGQAMLRFWVPLGNSSAPHRWLYQGQANQGDFRNVGRADDWCLREMICR